MSFNAKTNLLWAIQIFVKRCDARFMCNPYEMFGGKSRVAVSFETIESMNKFDVLIAISEQPYF